MSIEPQTINGNWTTEIGNEDIEFMEKVASLLPFKIGRWKQLIFRVGRADLPIALYFDCTNAKNVIAENIIPSYTH